MESKTTPSAEVMDIVSAIRRIDCYGENSVIASLTYSEAAQLIEDYGATQYKRGWEEAFDKAAKVVKEIQEAWQKE